jgi:hypothetical protein
MDSELAVIASSAATTIVNLLATDAWHQVKDKIGDLWRRFRPEQAEAVESELDRARREITGADETVTLAVTREWESRLLRLLAADSAVTADLGRVVSELRQISAGAQARGDVRQSARASGQSTVIQIGGDGAIGEFPHIRQRHVPGGKW